MDKDVMQWVLLVVNGAPIQTIQEARMKSRALTQLSDLVEESGDPEIDDLQPE